MRASAEITSGNLPMHELSYQWFRVEGDSTNATLLEEQTGSALYFEQTELTHDGSYYVEISSSTLRCRSRTMRLRVMMSVLAKVQATIDKEGQMLTSDTPRAVIVDSSGNRMSSMLLPILLTEALTVYVAAVSLEYDLDTPLQCEEDLPSNMTHKESLIFWLDTMRIGAPTAPILVVCTKADLVSEVTRVRRVQAIKDCVESSAAFKCGARIIGYQVVSSATCEGIEAVRDVLEAERTLLERYGSTVSVGCFKFFSIIGELACQEHHITWSQAKSIAHSCGITSDAEIRSLLQDMTNIGLLLWHDTAYACKLVILDVEWIITQATELLCRRRIEERLLSENCAHTGRLIQLRDKGRLDAALIPEIWSGLRSDEERAAVLEYLVTFGLLAKLPSSPAQFSDINDKDKTVKIKDGMVELNNADFTVNWIGAWKDGAKKIVAVEDWCGGKVSLDDQTAFENPVSQFYVVPALLPKSQDPSV